MTVEDGIDRAPRRQLGEASANAREQPVHVHARMPVEAAVERRMKAARREDIGVGFQHVVELVRVIACDVVERPPPEALGGCEVQGGVGLHMTNVD